MKAQLAFLLLTASSSILFLVSSAHAFQSLEPVAIISAVWVVLLAGIIGITVGRIVRRVPMARSARHWFRAFIIFVIHSLVIAAWYGWASSRESQSSPGGWVATMLLHYTIEVPSSGTCWLVEFLWRRHTGHGFRAEWLYPIYVVVGGAFYAFLPSLFRATAKLNATTVA